MYVEFTRELIRRESPGREIRDAVEKVLKDFPDNHINSTALELRTLLLDSETPSDRKNSESFRIMSKLKSITAFVLLLGQFWESSDGRTSNNRYDHLLCKYIESISRSVTDTVDDKIEIEELILFMQSLFLALNIVLCTTNVAPLSGVRNKFREGTGKILDAVEARTRGIRNSTGVNTLIESIRTTSNANTPTIDCDDKLKPLPLPTQSIPPTISLHGIGSANASSTNPPL